MAKLIAQHQVSDADLCRSCCYDRGELNDVVSQRVRVVLSLGALQDYMVGKNDEIVALALGHSCEITDARRFEIGEPKPLFHFGLPQGTNGSHRNSAAERILLRSLEKHSFSRLKSGLISQIAALNKDCQQ
jgi:hypothetical protein